jgi:hypothetical protein
MLSRTGAFCCASLLANAATNLLASPSSDPAAMERVVGRTCQCQANSPALVIRTTAPATKVIRSQMGSLIASMLRVSHKNSSAAAL